MPVAYAGWILIALGCAGALGCVAGGVVRLLGAQRDFERRLSHLEETQRLVLDPARIDALANRLNRSGAEAVQLFARLAALRC